MKTFFVSSFVNKTSYQGIWMDSDVTFSPELETVASLNGFKNEENSA